MSVEELDTNPLPCGELALQTIAMPRDTNANGDIFGGWLLSQMDLAGSITASELAEGRVATVAIEGMSFLTPGACRRGGQLLLRRTGNRPQLRPDSGRGVD